MHTYILPHTSTHTHIQSTRTHTERARPAAAAAAFFRFFFRYTPCFRIYFSYSPLYVREKIKKKPKNRCFFFNRNFMRNMFAALLAQNFFSSSFLAQFFFEQINDTFFVSFGIFFCWGFCFEFEFLSFSPFPSLFHIRSTPLCTLLLLLLLHAQHFSRCCFCYWV